MFTLFVPIPLGSFADCVVSRSFNDLGPFFPDIHVDERFVYENVKVKFTLEKSTKAQRGSRGIVLLFL